jgi:hypothetical protein
VLVLQNRDQMVMQSRRGPKVSQEVAVSWAVVAHVAHFGSQTARFVGGMNCATDGDAAVVADIAVASGKVVAAVGLVGDHFVHMPGAVADNMYEACEVACWIAHSTEYVREISARQDSYHCLAVAVRIVRAAEGQVTEVAR